MVGGQPKKEVELDAFCSPSCLDDFDIFRRRSFFKAILIQVASTIKFNLSTLFFFSRGRAGSRSELWLSSSSPSLSSFPPSAHSPPRLSNPSHPISTPKMSPTFEIPQTMKALLVRPSASSLESSPFDRRSSPLLLPSLSLRSTSAAVAK